MAKSTRSGDADDATMASARSTVEQSRQNLANYAEGASVLLRSAQSFHEVQQQMLERVALTHQQAADKLRDASTPAELLAVQSQLIMSAMQEAVQYLQDLLLSTVRVQSEMMRVPGQQPMRAAAGAAPIVQAWQNMFLAPMNGSGGAGTH